MAEWNANLYLKFADARQRPAIDLMNRLDPANGERPDHAIYDLGCGAGNITRILAERFPAQRTLVLPHGADFSGRRRLLDVGGGPSFETLRRSVLAAPQRGMPVWEAIDAVGTAYDVRELTELVFAQMLAGHRERIAVALLDPDGKPAIATGLGDAVAHLA